MTALFRQLAAWHRRLEDRARCKELIRLIDHAAKRAQEFRHLDLAELLLCAVDVWAAGKTDEGILALERLRRAADAEAANR